MLVIPLEIINHDIVFIHGLYEECSIIVTFAVHVPEKL